jgi:hypothetical protein
VARHVTRQAVTNFQTASSRPRTPPDIAQVIGTFAAAQAGFPGVAAPDRSPDVFSGNS